MSPSNYGLHCCKPVEVLCGSLLRFDSDRSGYEFGGARLASLINCRIAGFLLALFFLLALLRQFFLTFLELVVWLGHIVTFDRRTGRMESTSIWQDSSHQRLFPGVQGNPGLALALGLVVCGHAFAEGIAGFPIHLGGLDTLDAAPTFTGLGKDLAHLFDGMMFSAVVAVCCFSSHDREELLSRFPARRCRWDIARNPTLDSFDRLAVTESGHVAA